MSKIKIYKDPNLKEEIKSNELDLGKLEAGSSKEYTFYVFNASKDDFEDLKFNLNNDELKVIKSPIELKSKTFEKLIIVWEADINLEEGLKAKLIINGYRVIKPI